MTQHSITPDTTIYLRADAGYGHGGKQYIARLVGRHRKFTFEREFIGRKFGKRNEGCDATVDEVGVYELREVTRKGRVDRYRLILPAVCVAAHLAVAEDAEAEGREDLGAELRREAEGLVMVRLDRSEAMALCRRLDQGDRLDEIVRVVGDDEIEILTAAQAKRAAAAATVDEAVSACSAILAALPTREAKRVLTALRKQIAPPAPKASEVQS